MLEASTSRREKLESALRAKLEKQVRSLRGEIVHLKGKPFMCVLMTHEVATHNMYLDKEVRYMCVGVGVVCFSLQRVGCWQDVKLALL